MCHDHDALPPELPAHRVLPRLAGGAGAEALETTSADGTTVALALAQTPSPTGPAVVILPDVRGLTGFYRTLAERFAAAGHDAIVFDHFGRTDPLPRDESTFDKMAAAAAAEPEQVQADLAAAVAVLRERTSSEAIVAVGFCFGGTNAYLAAANPELGLAGVVAFYGGLTPDRFGFPHPVSRAADMRGPILGLFGEADPSIPAERVSEFSSALVHAGVEHDFHSYRDAPHGFFDQKAEEHALASADAWERTLAFLDGIEAKAHATA